MKEFKETEERPFDLSDIELLNELTIQKTGEHRCDYVLREAVRRIFLELLSVEKK